MRHILCFGNPLHGDDGFGPAVYQRLASLPCPGNVRVIDAGTPGLSALALFQNCDEVIIVDALSSGGEPGRLTFPLPQSVTEETSLPGHGVGVAYLLQALASLPEPAPRIQIIAAETAGVAPFQPGLSGPVAKAVDETVALLSPYFESNCHG